MNCKPRGLGRTKHKTNNQIIGGAVYRVWLIGCGTKGTIIYENAWRHKGTPWFDQQSHHYDHKPAQPIE